jgi:hypothetical protein
MTTNVPQDVIDLVVEHAENGNWPEFDAAIELLRAQRQQGSEPDVVYVADYYGDSLIGKYDENEKLYFMPDGDGYTKEQLAEFDVQFFHSTPPQANALVAAAYRKAAEICTEQDAFEPAESWQCAEAILSSIPAEAKADLREVCIKVANDINGFMEDYAQLSEENLLERVNSIIGAPSDKVEGKS